MLTVIVDPVPTPGLHANVAPGTPDAVKLDVPSQLLTTDTVGADGDVFGEAVTTNDAILVQPFTVWVTV